MVGEAGTPGRRVGELDEEMVYELRAGMHGDVIILGASSWRVEEIGHDRVTVTPGARACPASCRSGRATRSAGRSSSGRALGAFVGELEADLAPGRPRAGRPRRARLRETHDLDELAAENLLAYLEDEREVDRRPADRPADRRRALPRRARRLAAVPPDPVRRPGPRAVVAGARGADRRAAGHRGPDDLVRRRHRDPAARGRRPARRHRGAALPGPRRGRGPGRRAGWRRRRCSPAASARTRPGPCSCRAAGPGRGRRSGSSASGRPTCSRSPRATARFPILVETYRECLSDVFDLPALREILAGVARREIAVHGVETVRASPFASSLLFDYVAAYMYDGDAPLAERRAGALTLDRDLLRELLGQEELRELLDPDALADLELEPPGADRRPPGDDRSTSVHDLLRRLGDLSTDEVAARTEGGAGGRRAVARRARRGPPGRPDADRRRRPLDRDRGRRPLPRRGRDRAAGRRPGRVPRARRPAALDGLLARWARTHGPFLTPEPAAPLGPARRASSRTRSSGCSAPASILRGEFRPGRRRARVVRPGGPAAAPPALAGAAAPRGRAGRPGGARRGSCPTGRASPPVGPRPAAAARHRPRLERLAEVVDQLAGLPIPASVLERDVLPARIPGYQPRLLDELGALGEVAWVGRGSLGRDDGRIALVRPGREVAAAGRRARRTPSRRPGPATTRSASTSRGAGRVVLPRALRARPAAASDREVLDALWDLVWAGEVTNDTFAPLRALRWKRTGGAARAGDARGPGG